VIINDVFVRVFFGFIVSSALEIKNLPRAILQNNNQPGWRLSNIRTRTRGVAPRVHKKGSYWTSESEYPPESFPGKSYRNDAIRKLGSLTVPIRAGWQRC